MPVWGSLYFQNASGPVMEQMIFFHDHIMVVLVLIVFLVGYILLSSFLGGGFNRGLKEGQELESFWTVLPAVFLLVIAFPSLSLLYLMEEVGSPDLTVSVMGRQWYWTYEYSDMGLKCYDSYMIPEGGEEVFRLLEVDNGLFLPVNMVIRVVVTSGDVIHSWALPTLGLKVDGIPGRLNQVIFIPKLVGVYVGQCSEICGANHSFMPIVVSVGSVSDFLYQLI